MGSRRMKETLKLRELKAGGEEREGLGGVERIWRVGMGGGGARSREDREEGIN